MYQNTWVDVNSLTADFGEGHAPGGRSEELLQLGRVWDPRLGLRGIWGPGGLRNKGQCDNFAARAQQQASQEGVRGVLP